MKHAYLQEDQYDQWEAFLQSYPEGTLYHGTEWKQTIETAFSHIKGRILVLVNDRDGSIVSGMPIYEIDSWILGKRLVCTPYSTWCNPLASNQEQFDLLMKEISNYGKSRNSKSIEIRMRGDVRFTPPPEWKLNTLWKHHTLQLKQEVWENLPLTAIRQRIRKSHRNGVVVTLETGEAAMKTFYSALIESRKRLRLPMIPYRYFSSIQKNLSKGNIRIHIARLNNDVLSACLAIQVRGICHFEFTGEYPESRKFKSVHALTWAAIEQAQADGCEEFSFGRTSLANSGLIQYKRQWNTEEEDLQVLSWNLKESSNSQGNSTFAERILKQTIPFLPRPVYRQLGSFIYSHWG